MNSDLGLGRLTVLPVAKSSVIFQSINPYSAQVQRLEKKLDLIHRGLKEAENIHDIRLDLKLSLEGEARFSSNHENNLVAEMNGNGLSLDEELHMAIQSAFRTPCAYLYFKRWKLGEKVWFKIGRTNSLDRRDKEQNVLPVPSETLKSIKLTSMDKAKAIESALHNVLRIEGLLGLGIRNYIHLMAMITKNS